jgi:hypothetical protein
VRLSTTFSLLLRPAWHRCRAMAVPRTAEVQHGPRSKHGIFVRSGLSSSGYMTVTVSMCHAQFAPKHTLCCLTLIGAHEIMPPNHNPDQRCSGDCPCVRTTIAGDVVPNELRRSLRNTTFDINHQGGTNDARNHTEHVRDPSSHCGCSCLDRPPSHADSST